MMRIGIYLRGHCGHVHWGMQRFYNLMVCAVQCAPVVISSVVAMLRICEELHHRICWSKGQDRCPMSAVLVCIHCVYSPNIVRGCGVI
jgi:hypothetical protein